MPITDLATNVILDNVGKVYFLKSGVYRDPVGLDNNHPLSSVSAMLIHIEDGVPQNVMLANYAPSKMASWASHNFPLWYRGQVEYTIAGESAPRTFAQYFTYIPSILVAMNKNGASIMDVNVTITQNTGANLLGGFADLMALNTEYPPTEELSDDVATAYIYDSATKGFYRVAWNTGTSAWEWTLITQALVTYGVQTKQYNVLPIKVQRGFAPNQTPLNVSDEVVRLIYQEIAYVNAVIANHTELIQDLELEVINNFQALKSLLGIATENDWNYEGEFPTNIMPPEEQAEGVNFHNSRNGWLQVGSDFYIFGGMQYISSGVYSSINSKFAYKYNLLTKVWTKLADMPFFSNESRAVHKDGVIYLFGGWKKTLYNDSEYSSGYINYKYTIATDTYEALSEAPIMNATGSGAVLVGDDVYVFVDRTWVDNVSTVINTTPLIYHIATDTWDLGTATNTTFDRGFAALYDGKIYVQRSLKFQSYDYELDTWDTTLTPPTYGLVHTGLMQVSHGRLFIGSGWESALAKNTSFIQYYNVERDTWQVATRLEHLSKALGYGSLALYNEKLYYIGGYSNETTPVSNVYVRSFNLEKLQLDRVDALYEQVYDLEDRMDTAEEDIDDLETFRDVTVPATYETKADATTHKGRTTALENANMIKSIARTGTNLITITYFNNTTATVITLNELKSFIGNATQSLAGLMSAQDKVDLDTLMALFDSDGDSVVNTIAEILAIFEDYPEGVDLVTALAGKVDKTTTIAGVDLADNITKEELKIALDIDDAESRLDTAESDIDDLEQKDVLHDSRINAIEEQLRKSTSGENTATKSGTDIIPLGKDVANAPINVLVEGGLLDAPQLVTNGDFSNGTTGWTSVASNISVTNGILKAISTAIGTYGISRSITASGVDKQYSFMLVKNSIGGNLSHYIGNSGFQTYSVVANNWQVISFIGNTSITTFRVYSSSNTIGDYIEIDKTGYFNISTLQSNKQYSPIYDTTFDLMSDAQIKAQMDKWVLDGTLPNDIMAVSMDKRIRSVGKNLFDSSYGWVIGTGLDASGNTTSASTLGYNTQYVNVKPSVSYVISSSTTISINRILYYDIDKVFISRFEIGVGVQTFTTPSNAYYIRYTYNIATGAVIPQNFQLELGSTATTYQPYISHDLYLQSGEVGYRLPNLVNDSISLKNGKGYFTRRVQRYVLQASDITAISSHTNVQLIRITKSLDYLGYNSTASATNLNTAIMPPYGTSLVIADSYDQTKYFEQIIANQNATQFWLIKPLGTYANLTSAQTTLAGTVIYYQLATPIETEILTIGNAQVGPNSSIYIDDMKWATDIYTTNITVDTAISELVSITKMNIDGSETQLAVSGATVSGDGLSFTHSGLTSGDAVRFTYIPRGNYFKGNTDVIYYDSPLIVVDSVTSTVYKLVPTVASGVITWTVEEV